MTRTKINQNNTKNIINVSFLETNLGKFILGSYNNKLCILDFYTRNLRNHIDNKIQKTLDANFIQTENEILIKTKKQIREYLDKDRKIFDISLMPIGTDFQKLVWNELLKIPYGKTISYKELAKNIGNPKAFRAVALANSLNPLAIIIPCHRVIASDGSLGGYSGGISTKRKLLEIEKI